MTITTDTTLLHDPRRQAALPHQPCRNEPGSAADPAHHQTAENRR